MGFWSRLFGAETRTSKLSGDSPYLPKKSDEVEVIFANLFTKKGGKFIQTNVENLEQINTNETIIRSGRKEYKFEKTVVASYALEVCAINLEMTLYLHCNFII